MKLKFLVILIAMFFLGTFAQDDTGTDEDEGKDIEEGMRELMARESETNANEGNEGDAADSDLESLIARTASETAENEENDGEAGIDSDLASLMERTATGQTEKRTLSGATQKRQFLQLPIRPLGCCLSQTMWISLRGRGYTYGYVPFVSRPTYKPRNVSRSCATSAFFKANFQPLKRGCTGCTSEPECGRRMLQLDLYLSDTKSGHLVNIGDSVTNNGYGGDANTQRYDAELHAVYPHLRAHKSDNCRGNLLTTVANAFSSAVDHVRFYISHQFFQVQNDQGLNRRLCSSCLFALNRQNDTGPGNVGINQDIFVGLNKVIQSTSNRVGNGVCYARVKWACPCNN